MTSGIADHQSKSSGIAELLSGQGLGPRRGTLMLGPTIDLKIVILRNLPPKEDHAVAAARVDGKC
jgi:hypothetical protein